MTTPSTYRPAAAAVAAETQATAQGKSDADRNAAIEILKQAVLKTAGTPMSATELASYAETLWKWADGDTWPPAATP
jgi:hypothetical protein